MDQYSREFIAEKARLRPEDLGLVGVTPPLVKNCTLRR